MAAGQRTFTPGLYLRRHSFYRGVLGGNRGWLTLFLVLMTGRAFRRIAAKSERTAAIERLGPGQRLVITTIDPKTERRSRKRR
jgi:hypothetical protein